MASLERRSDWNARLDALLLGCIATPFEWGTHDCATLAASALDAQYGTDFAKRMGEKYAGLDETGLRDLCYRGGGIRAIVDGWLGTNRLPINLCARGDIVLYADDYGQPYGLAVHDGQQIVAPGVVGLQRVPLHHAIVGWRPI